MEQLIEYIRIVNEGILSVQKLTADGSKSNFNKLFCKTSEEIKTLNFNYTETLNLHKYANENDLIHIHGRVAEKLDNPIIFGYGDESDPAYQGIEDSGENIYLEHIKSFGYFKTNNYHKLLSYIDSTSYSVQIVGHSAVCRIGYCYMPYLNIKIV
ncbi:MAG: hypothetical protein IPL50_13175 [Chitinophagaceae bacterium]|nr:hypothetical protein [Chitinophagaceae bacterium]